MSLSLERRTLRDLEIFPAVVPSKCFDVTVYRNLPSAELKAVTRIGETVGRSATSPLATTTTNDSLAVFNARRHRG